MDLSRKKHMLGVSVMECRKRTDGRTLCTDQRYLSLKLIKWQVCTGGWWSCKWLADKEVVSDIQDICIARLKISIPEFQILKSNPEDLFLYHLKKYMENNQITTINGSQM
jgi:hypothetical protein